MIRMSKSDHFLSIRPYMGVSVHLLTLSNDNSSETIEAICP